MEKGKKLGYAYLNRLKKITDGSDKDEELDRNHLCLQLSDSDNYSAIDEDFVDKMSHLPAAFNSSLFRQKASGSVRSSCSW